MGELIPSAGSQQGPIQFRKNNCKHIIFVLGNGIELELACHNFIERIRERRPKESNKAETEEVTFFKYTSRLIEVRGNRVAMDLLRSFSFDCILSHVQQSNGANPDQDDDKKDPVVYSVRVIEEPPAQSAQNAPPPAQTTPDPRQRAFNNGKSSGRP